MKALHVITGLGVGGAEQQLRLLLRHLPLECEVVTLTNPGSVADGLRADGVRVHHLRMGGNRDLGALPRLTRLIRRGRYDLVHTHLYRACVYGRIAARLAGVRATVATEHSLGEAEIEGRPLTRPTRALYLGTERLGSATVAVSHTVAGRLRAWGVPQERIHVVPNGIDAARFRFDPERRAAVRARLGIAPDAFVVGGVGRLVAGKRFDALVRAVAALPDALLLVAGDGPERGALRSLAAELGVAERVRFLGELDGAPPGGGRPEPAAGDRAPGGAGAAGAGARSHRPEPPAPGRGRGLSVPGGRAHPSGPSAPVLERGGDGGGPRCGASGGVEPGPGASGSGEPGPGAGGSGSGGGVLAGGSGSGGVGSCVSGPGAAGADGAEPCRSAVSAVSGVPGGALAAGSEPGVSGSGTAGPGGAASGRARAGCGSPLGGAGPGGPASGAGSALARRSGGSGGSGGVSVGGAGSGGGTPADRFGPGGVGACGSGSGGAEPRWAGAAGGAPAGAARAGVSGSGAGCGSPGGERLPDLLSALDVFVSASREEAFGLAVVEALAAGLPVFHSTCPAVDDLPADQSPGAHRVDGTPEALTAALRRQRHAAPRRREPPPVVRHYDIAESGRRLTRLYERVLAAPQPSRPPAPPVPPVPPSPTERARP